MESVRIADICSQVYSGGTPTSTNSSYYDGGIPWLNTNEVNFCNIYKTNRTISEEGLKHSAAKFVSVNTIIVAMYGVTAGRSAIAKIPLTTNQACCNLVIDSKKANYQYVYYFLKQQAAHLNSLANGGAQQNLNSLLIKKYSISLPSLKEQDKIASILSVYDDLIEKNNRKIAILQEMAEELYKEWFVRFRFPGYKTAKFKEGLPEGWTSGRIEDLGSFTRGKNITADEMIEGNIPVISAGIEPSGFHCESNVKGVSLTISSSGANAGYMRINYSDIWAADCSFVNNVENIFYMYELLNNIRPFLDNLQKGAAQPHVYAKDVNRLKIVLPKKELRTKFNEITKGIHLTIATLQKQNENLTQQRDLLLPRLMSGKLEVKA